MPCISRMIRIDVKVTYRMGCWDSYNVLPKRSFAGHQSVQRTYVISKHFIT